MNIWQWLFALAALAVCPAGADGDGEEKPDLDELMTQVDTDKDGKISWPEMLEVFEGPDHVQERYHGAFRECDVDKDDLISREELNVLFVKLTAIILEEDKKVGKEEI